MMILRLLAANARAAIDGIRRSSSACALQRHLSMTARIRESAFPFLSVGVTETGAESHAASPS
jgi:hypothetical protein